jgi:hypothetical protein
MVMPESTMTHLWRWPSNCHDCRWKRRGRDSDRLASVMYVHVQYSWLRYLIRSELKRLNFDSPNFCRTEALVQYSAVTSIGIIQHHAHITTSELVGRIVVQIDF